MDKSLNTAGLFIGAFALFTKGVDFAFHLIEEPRIALVKTGAILFPLFIIIGTVTTKIFDELGWQPSEVRSITIYAFTFISSTVLASAAAVKFGLSASSKTAWIISGVIFPFFGFGICCLIQGFENIYLGANHRPPIF